jgi:hypothetical protein
MRYELGFYIPTDGIFHRHRRENLESYIVSGCGGNVRNIQSGHSFFGLGDLSARKTIHEL